MPTSEGSAFSAASRVNITRCPRAPAGALSLAAFTTVNTPSNGTRLGCPSTWGIFTAIASNRMRSPLHEGLGTQGLELELMCGSRHDDPAPDGGRTISSRVHASLVLTL